MIKPKKEDLITIETPDPKRLSAKNKAVMGHISGALLISMLLFNQGIIWPCFIIWVFVFAKIYLDKKTDAQLKNHFEKVVKSGLKIFFWLVFAIALPILFVLWLLKVIYPGGI